MTRLFNYLWLCVVAVSVQGCAFDQATESFTGKGSRALQQATSSTETLTVLSITGGLCLVAGLALLTISRGARGWFPAIGGVILVILNYVVAEYSTMLFYPLVVCTGLISAAWTYKTVRRILLEKQK